ncbi:unnamed protein product [Mytilus coruscus]|uniref:Ig-like domain-containing protein n=1 Tax=Mytilus coruscus TaxID=42192 RepID=A0A6J7ZXI6_MYTCO|nr:unnamed protein product [Mytilus coruscus]
MTLFCIYESNHGITQLKWKRKLNEQGNREDMGVNWTLVIRNIKRQEAGLYKCTVTNRAGYESYYISVVVQYPPTVQFKFEESEYSRELECIPKGIPDRYSFNQWEHKSEYMEHIRFLPYYGSGKLVIPFESGETDRHHDKGIYICNVSNNVSFSDKRFISANYFLNASGKMFFI